MYFQSIREKQMDKDIEQLQPQKFFLADGNELKIKVDVEKPGWQHPIESDTV